MKRTTKYVALDVHQAMTVASVREENGRVIARTVVPTEAPALVEFFRGMRGAVHVVFEEGTQAQWLRSEEHTSELQSHSDLVCRLLLEKKKRNPTLSRKRAP